MRIDQYTIFWVFMLLQPVGATVYWLTTHRHPHLTGPGWWIAGCISAMFGFGGILLKGYVPALISLNLANALIVAATLCLWAGLRAFFGKSVPKGFLVWIVLIAATAHCLFTFVWPSLAARTAVVSFFNGFGTLFALREVINQRESPKPVELKLLGGLLAIDGALHMVRILGALIPSTHGVDSTPSPLEGAFLLTFFISGVARLILFVTLISGRLQDERKAAEEEINNLAFYDPLTCLPNRRLLFDRLKQVMASNARSRKYGALLCIDLDNFKNLNDNLGHQIGDLLLQNVAQRLTANVREGDTVARLGGDEFLIILKELSEKPHEAAAQAEAVSRKILDALNVNYLLLGNECHSTPSIGVTVFSDHQGTIDDLLKRADLAMYEAKSAGRNAVRFFDPKMEAAVSARAIMDAGLREAILKDQFRLHYQAQVDDAGRLTGVEALLRWEHPEQGLVAPLSFISLAEDTGLILPLGRWVIETACAQLALWATQAEMTHLTIAVNVSARQFHHHDFAEHVLASLKQHGADPQKLKLELTESLLLDDVDDVIAKMTLLKSHGVTFSLDDFGTGYSSLAYLKRLPLDQLKIDRSFVRDILTDPNDASIARSIVTLAQSLGLAVIAEGVETQAQRDFLASSGCHAYQGYFFGRPLPIESFDNAEVKQQ